MRRWTWACAGTAVAIRFEIHILGYFRASGRGRNFTDAAQVIASLQSAFTALDTTETAAKTRAIGTVAARDNAKAALLTALHGAKAYVQAKADASPDQAQPIIESAAMTVRKT